MISEFLILGLVVLMMMIVRNVMGAGEEVKGKEVVRTVAVLVYEGVELLDFAGPAEVFIVANHGKSFRVITVCASTESLKTMGGITVTPDFDYAHAPHADTVVVPGGNMQAVPEAGVSWIRRVSKEAEVTLSVCFGSYLLARAGLLDGIEATTHHWGIAGLKKVAPQCMVVEGKRYVESGSVISTAGVSAGIDGALRIVERMLGAEEAKWTAQEWMEHHWQKP